MAKKKKSSKLYEIEKRLEKAKADINKLDMEGEDIDSEKYLAAEDRVIDSEIEKIDEEMRSLREERLYRTYIDKNDEDI